MHLYQKIGTYALIGAAAMATISGCGPKPAPEISERHALTQIQKFGVTAYQDASHRGWEERTSVAVADIDGDGDLDIIVSNAFGEVIVLENNIPQKRK